MSGPSTTSIFDARVLELIRKAILAGDVMPQNKAMSARLKCADSTVTSAMTRLTASGACWVRRVGNHRIAGIHGVGQTSDVPVAEARFDSARTLSPDDIEMRRVERSTCFRCGGRVEGWVHDCAQKDGAGREARPAVSRYSGSHTATGFGEGWGGDIAPNKLARA